MDANNNNIILPTQIRKCRCCGKELPITEFNHYRPNTYRLICKSCQENNIPKNDKFKDVTSRELILELRARGYRGKLTKIITKDIVI